MSAELLCLTMVFAVCGLLLAGFPVAFTLAGVAGAFAFLGHALGQFDLALLAAFPQRIFAIMTSEVLVAVPLFVFMGVMLERSGVAEALIVTMGRLFARLPGGLAISVSLVGMLLAASTGIVGASVVAIGLLALPVMLRAGYHPGLAAGSVAAAGTLGQIIPPSIVLVLLGDQMSAAYQNAQFARGDFAPDTVSVNDLFAGALLPGLMLVAAYIGWQLACGLIWPDRAPALKAEAPGDTDGGRRGAGGRGQGGHFVFALLAPLALIVAVLGSILGGLASPGEAAGIGAVGALLLAGHRFAPDRPWPMAAAVFAVAGLLLLAANADLRFGLAAPGLAAKAAFLLAIVLAVVLACGIGAALMRCRAMADGSGEGGEGENVLGRVLSRSVIITSMIFTILIGATLFSLVFRGLHGDRAIEEMLTGLPGGAPMAVVVVMATMFVLGFFLDFLEIIFIVVPVVAPILLQMEITPGVPLSPVWLGVLMAVNLQTSFLTPPFGVALFYLRGVAPPALTTWQIYRGVVPFIMLQLLALMALWLWPGLATWLPGLLYGP